MDNFVVATLWKKTSAPYTYHNICIDDISYDMMKHDISFLANPSQHLRNHLTLTPRVILVIVVSKQLVPHLLSLILLKGRTMAYQHTWGNSLLLPWDSWLFQESCPSSFSQNLRLVSLKIINDQTHSKLALKAKENEKRHCTWNQSSSNPSLPGLKSSFWELLHCLTRQDKRGNSPRSWEEAGWVEDWAASSWHHFATKNLPNHCGETPGQRNPMSKLKLFQPLKNC